MFSVIQNWCAELPTISNYHPQHRTGFGRNLSHDDVKNYSYEDVVVVAGMIKSFVCLIFKVSYLVLSQPIISHIYSTLFLSERFNYLQRDCRREEATLLI